MSRLLLLLVALLLSNVAISKNFPFYCGEKYALCDKEGVLLTDCKYNQIIDWEYHRDLYLGMTAIGKWALLNSAGQEAKGPSILWSFKGDHKDYPKLSAYDDVYSIISDSFNYLYFHQEHRLIGPFKNLPPPLRTDFIVSFVPSPNSPWVKAGMGPYTNHKYFQRTLPSGQLVRIDSLGIISDEPLYQRHHAQDKSWYYYIDENEKLQLFNKKEELLIKGDYKYVGALGENFLALWKNAPTFNNSKKVTGNKITVIDRKGKIMLDAAYESLYLQQGKYIATTDSSCILLNENFTVQFEAPRQRILYITEDIFLLIRPRLDTNNFNNSNVYFQDTSNVIFENIQHLRKLKNHFLLRKADGNRIFKNQLYDLSFNKVGITGKNFIDCEMGYLFEREDHVGMMNYTGEVQFQFPGSKIRKIGAGIFRIKALDKWQLYDHNKKILRKGFEFEQVYAISTAPLLLSYSLGRNRGVDFSEMDIRLPAIYREIRIDDGRYYGKERVLVCFLENRNKFQVYDLNGKLLDSRADEFTHVRIIEAPEIKIVRKGKMRGVMRIRDQQVLLPYAEQQIDFIYKENELIHYIKVRNREQGVLFLDKNLQSLLPKNTNYSYGKWRFTNDNHQRFPWLVVQKKGKYGLYNLNTKKVTIPLEYKRMHFINEDTLVAEKAGFFQLYNKNGQLLSKDKYLNFHPFKNGVASAHIPAEGDSVTKKIWTDPYGDLDIDFCAGMEIKIPKYQVVFLDSNFNNIFDRKFEDAPWAYDSIMTVTLMENNKAQKYVINGNGQLLFPLKMNQKYRPLKGPLDGINEQDDGHFLVANSSSTPLSKKYKSIRYSQFNDQDFYIGQTDTSATLLNKNGQPIFTYNASRRLHLLDNLWVTTSSESYYPDDLPVNTYTFDGHFIQDKTWILAKAWRRKHRQLRIGDKVLVFDEDRKKLLW